MKFRCSSAYSFGKSQKCTLEKADPLYTPGPGQYAPSLKQKRKDPEWKIGTALRSQKGVNGVPGPGQYAPQNNLNHVRPKTPTWKIGTGKRPNLNQADLSVPGPGNYNVAKLLGNGPKYSMVGKNNYGKDNKNGVPGPGQYSYTKAHLAKEPSWKIGTGARDDDLKRVMREGVPGPGMYNTSSQQTAPKYRFGSEKRGVNQRNDTPGPGQYHIPCSIVDVNDYTRNAGSFDGHYRYI